MLKYGYAKAKYTANATYRQTLVLQAAQVVKVVVRKAQHHLADVATKEAANVVVNAEAADQVVTEEVDQVQVETNAAGAVIVRVARVDRIVVVVVLVVIVQVAVTVRVDQVKDNNQSRDRHRLDIKA